MTQKPQRKASLRRRSKALSGDPSLSKGELVCIGGSVGIIVHLFNMVILEMMRLIFHDNLKTRVYVTTLTPISFSYLSKNRVAYPKSSTQQLINLGVYITQNTCFTSSEKYAKCTSDR